jgi:membrane protein implicated in regulation of membrane protease activity
MMPQVHLQEMLDATTMRAMGLVYLAALVIGLGILLVQVAFGGRDGEHGLGHAAGPVDGAAGDASGEDHPLKAGHPGDDGPLAVVFSFRFWIFAFLGFGLSGSLLHFLNLAGAGAVAILASAAGIGSGAFASLVVRAVTRSSASSSVNLSEAVGREARVLVTCEKGRTGQVRIALRGQSVDLLATTDEEDIARGEPVLIEDVRDGVAQISRRPRELDD